MAGIFDLGSIRAVMGMDNSNFVQGMLSSQTAAQVFGSSVVNFINNPLLGTISILKSVASGTASLLKETAEINKEYLHTSERLGIAVRTVSGLQLAYRDLGLPGQELEKHLVILSKLMDDAARGNATAQQTFDRLGVSLVDSVGKLRSLDAVFRDVSDGLARMENAQARVSVANDVFGRGAERVISVIGAGSRVMEDNIATAERWGQAVTERGARAAAILSDAIDGANFSFEGFKRNMATRFTIGFVEDLGNASAATDRLATSMNRFGDTFENLGRLFTPVLDGIDLLIIALEKLQRISESVSDWTLENPIAGRLLTAVPGLQLSRDAFIEDAADSMAPGSRGSRDVERSIAERRTRYEEHQRHLEAEEMRTRRARR